MAEITFDTAAGDAVFEPWGSGDNQYFHFKKAEGATTATGTVFCIHGTPQETAGIGNAIQFFNAVTAGNLTAERLLEDGYNIVSLSMERAQVLTDPTTSDVDDHSQGPSGTGLLRANRYSGQTFVPYLYLQIQEAICSVKEWVWDQGYGDPDRCAGLGYSFGAWLQMMAQILPPIHKRGLAFEGATQLYTREDARGTRGPRSPSTGRVFDSRLRCLVNAQGQPDLRRGVISAPDTPAIMSYHAGVDSVAEYAAVPDRVLNSMSVLWHLEQGNTRWWVPTLSAYPTPPETNAGIYPLEEPHDPVQGYTLDAAARRLNLPHEMLPLGIEATAGNVDRAAGWIKRWTPA